MLICPSSHHQIIFLTLISAIVVFIFLIDGNLLFADDVTTVFIANESHNSLVHFRHQRQASFINNDSQENYGSGDSSMSEGPPLTALFNDVLISHYRSVFSFPINNPRMCDPKHGDNLTLLIVVTSAVGKADAREAIRHTWGGYARQRGAKMIFLLGQTRKKKVRQAVEDENALAKDIVQANFVDNYTNMTLKTVSMMKWVADHCPKVAFVLKTDDDMLINIDLLFDYIKTNAKMRKTVVGKVATNWSPHRNAWNKWYVSKRIFPETHFPDFTTGPAYLLTGDSVRPLYVASLGFPFFQLEDVLITGIVADRIGIKRVNHPQMRNRPVKVTKCNFGSIMTSHKYTPRKIEDVWMQVNRKDVQCRKVKKTKKILPLPFDVKIREGETEVYL